MKKFFKVSLSILVSLFVGAVNGFFGGGGGMILVPLLTGKCGLDQRKAFATSPSDANPPDEEPPIRLGMNILRLSVRP